MYGTLYAAYYSRIVPKAKSRHGALDTTTKKKRRHMSSILPAPTKINGKECLFDRSIDAAVDETFGLRA